MRFLVVIAVAFIVFLAGCASKTLPPVVVKVPDRTIDYLNEIKPLLDKRCVVCHSCSKKMPVWIRPKTALILFPA